jgi:hypothetical protein
VEEGNPFNATTVVYTITAQDGHFCVSGVDESDGVILSITKTSWDGEELHFVSLFPPTNHISNHAFLLTGDARAKHKVSYSDEDGIHTVNEVWKTRLPR